MKMPQVDRRALWDLTASAGLSSRFIADAGGRVALADLLDVSPLRAPLEWFRGKSVLILSDRQLPAVLSLLQLDGVARRVLLWPPDLTPALLPHAVAEAQIEAIVSDGTGPEVPPPRPPMFLCAAAPVCEGFPGARFRPRECEPTEWLLFTSGTSGRPKIVVHDLTSLTGPLVDGLGVAPDAIWSTFYDMRRYGGLTILLRALLGGGSMVLSQADESVDALLLRAGESGVTHISGTPSHWRRALMSEAHERMSPRYVRLSGEVADQSILNQLAATYPDAEVAHAFASTEAGFAFDVRDGKAGFPAALIRSTGDVDLRVQDGSLCIRSRRAALRYLGAHAALADRDGFIDTGDMLDLRGDRYYFVGRREGVINVGGRKVHPEEVEAVISQHPDVLMARVRGRPSPITGAIVVADIVVRAGAGILFASLREEILDECRLKLSPHKVPAILTQVASLDIAASGKLVRRFA